MIRYKYYVICENDEERHNVVNHATSLSAKEVHYSAPHPSTVCIVQYFNTMHSHVETTNVVELTPEEYLSLSKHDNEAMKIILSSAEIYNNKIQTEYNRAIEKHPVFTKDLVYGAAIVAEEAGELLKEANTAIETGVTNIDNLETEAIHTIITAVRFLEKLSESKEE